MNRKPIIVMLMLAAVGMVFLHLLLPSCVHPLRGNVVICGDGVHIRVTQMSQAPRLCVPFWWLSMLFTTFAALAFIRGLRPSRHRTRPAPLCVAWGLPRVDERRPSARNVATISSATYQAYAPNAARKG